MAEVISKAESNKQNRDLQLLMMEAYNTRYPDVGLLVETDEPELLIEYLYRAKQKDVMLQDMVISIKSKGVVIYHDLTKDRFNVDEASTNVQEDNEPSDGEAHTDL